MIGISSFVDGRRLAALFSIIALTLAAGPAPKANAVSNGAEATIYLRGDFSGGFNVAYGAVLRSTATNRSATFLDVMLTGRRDPGPSIELGLTRDARNGFGALRVFTAVRTRSGTYRYAASAVSCVPSCTLILRGDPHDVTATIASDGGIRRVGVWRRGDFDLRAPYVRLNGEVAKRGDAIDAALTPMRVVAAARELAAPACGFTVHGVTPRRLPGGTLTFTGTNRADAPASSVDLTRRRMASRCAGS